MSGTTANLSVQRYPPEQPKFRSPIVFVHTVWTGGWSWKTWATHFSNLGWEACALTLPGRTGSPSHDELKSLTAGECVGALTAWARELSTSPVVVAHGTGALIAARAAEEIPFTALVLVSAAAPRAVVAERSRALKLMKLKYAPLIYLRRPFRIDEKDLRRVLLYPLRGDQQEEISRGIVPDSSALIRELLTPQIRIDPQRIHAPALVLSGGLDSVAPASAGRKLAGWLGADFLEYANQGHWMIEADSETIVRDVHRWIVRKLGETILPPEAL